MLKDYRIHIIIVVTGFSLVSGIFLFPPLTSTSGKNAIPPGMSQAEFEQTVSRELAFCQEQSGDIDCGCFADVSSYIQSQDVAQVPFAVYANQEELARGQASGSC